ncbi:hypothetical protein ACE0DR_25955 [Azotobacter sp. CWF10]
MPHYTMVTFLHTPYAEALRRNRTANATCWWPPPPAMRFTGQHRLGRAGGADPPRSCRSRRARIGWPTASCSTTSETFGRDPRRTRISQYAAIRTDADLNVIDTPVSFFGGRPMTCCPRRWPPRHRHHPQQALAEGISEAEAFDRINEQLSRPGTCALGYNTLRFDR